MGDRPERADGRWQASRTDGPYQDQVSAFSGPELAARTAVRRTDPYFRPGACRRRRDVLMVLICALTVTGLIGLIPVVHVLLFATVGIGVMLGAYVALLIRLRNQALEREAKLRYLPRTAEYAPSVALRRVASR
jgi:hypothetical protein